MEVLVKYASFPHITLTAQLSVVLLASIGPLFSSRKKSLSAESSIPLFAYATFSAILCLLCIGQGLIFLLSACFVSLPIYNKKIPAILTILSHPLFIIAIAVFLKHEFLYPGASFDLLDEIELYTQNENSNFQLVLSIALPLWTATIFSLGTSTTPSIKED